MEVNIIKVAIQEIVQKEILGQITLVRTRLSHNGGISTDANPNGWLPEHFYNAEQCGGGALIDLGCHPMYLTRLLLGLPEAVSASYGYVTGREVEDNAVATLQYANGALGIVEAGFVNAFSPFVIEVHGTDGSVLYSDHEGRVLLRTKKLADASTLGATHAEDGDQVTDIEAYITERPTLPAVQY